MTRTAQAAALCMTLAASSAATAAERVSVRGTPTKRWIENDDLGFYYEIPMGDELVIDIEGPGTLIMFIVNHEAVGTRGNSVLVVTEAKRAWKRLKLSCATTTKRFTDETGIQPCKRITRDLQIEAGQHRIGLRLKRTKVGASVHFLFASQEQLDLEPALAAVASHGDELSWEQAEDLDLVPLASTSATPDESSSSSALTNPWMWAFTGVAVAAAGTGAAFGIYSRARFDEAAGTVTQRRRIELNDAGEQSAILANTMFGVAGAAAVTAAVVFILDLQSAPKTPLATVAPVTGEHQWGITAHFSF